MGIGRLTALGGNDGRTDSESAHGATYGVLAGGGDLAGGVLAGSKEGLSNDLRDSGLDMQVRELEPAIIGEVRPVQGTEAHPDNVGAAGEVDAPSAPDEPQSVGVAATAVAREGIEAIVCAYDWDCGTALRIARCESTLRPDASNGTSWGLFAINAVHAGHFPDFWQSWSDPVTNTRWAYELWSEQGFAPWSCR